MPEYLLTFEAIYRFVGLRRHPPELYSLEPTSVERHLHSLAVLKRRPPGGEVAVGETGNQSGLDDPSVGDDQNTPAGGNGFQGPHPGFPLPLSHPSRGSTLADKVGEPDKRRLPIPPLVMPDLRRHGGREIAQCFEAVVHGKAHGDGGFQSPRDGAGKHQVAGADLPADPPRQRNTFWGKVRAFASPIALLRIGVASNLDRTHSVNSRRLTTQFGNRRASPGSRGVVGDSGGPSSILVGIEEGPRMRIMLPSKIREKPLDPLDRIWLWPLDQKELSVIPHHRRSYGCL